MSIIGNPIMAGGGGPTASIKVMGLSQSDTVTAAMGSKTKTAKWVTVPNPALHGLPDGYTELESIESTGTQYIDTGVIPDTNSGYEFDVTINSPFNSSDSISTGSIIGCYTSSDKSFGVSVSTKRFETGDVAFGSGRYAAHLVVGSRMQISLRNRTYTTSTGGTEIISNSLSTTISAFLFASHDTSVSGNVWGMAKAIMYSAKMYDGDTMIRNYIPAKRNSDGAIGLYDLVTGAFFPNAGTGVFTAGTEIQSYVSYWLIDGIRDFGTWTVTATNGTQTATQDVLVDVITEYEITMCYRFYLYNEGDECEDVTGGWTIDGYVYTGEIGGVRAGIKNADSFYLIGLPNSTAFGTAYKVDLSAYSTLYATFHYDKAKENPWVSALLGEKDLVGSNRYPNVCHGNGVDADITASADISGLSGNHFVVAACTSSQGGGYVYKIWLE